MSIVDMVTGGENMNPDFVFWMASYGRLANGQRLRLTSLCPEIEPSPNARSE